MTVERVLAIGWGYNVWGDRGANMALEFVGDMFFVTPFSPVGRLALSVYLTQSLAFTTLFYGYGLGFVGRTGPAGVTEFAILIFALQLVVCDWWVRRYRFGPAEWVWRGLTYGKFPAMRLQPAPDRSG
jgi:uncharacterized protein